VAFKTGCLICGGELAYEKDLRFMSCTICGTEKETEVVCVNDHYVCDQCHSISANDRIEQYCAQSTSTNPEAMALDLMKSPLVKMHGPEHHYLVPAVLIAAYFNQKGDKERKKKALTQAKKRAENVLGGFCGFYGACGAGVGTGIFISVITDATPLSTTEWRLANLITSYALEAIANSGGPRCCKRDTFIALQTAEKFLKDFMGISLKAEERIYCEYSSVNRECLREKCIFFHSNK